MNVAIAGKMTFFFQNVSVIAVLEFKSNAIVVRYSSSVSSVQILKN